jgi:hypothetical protein
MIERDLVQVSDASTLPYGAQSCTESGALDRPIICKGKKLSVKKSCRKLPLKTTPAEIQEFVFVCFAWSHTSAKRRLRP